MADPIADWHKEHELFSTVLSLLRKELDIFQAGGQPGYALTLDIICWLRDFGDTFHHPREDEAFRRLAQRCPDRDRKRQPDVLQVEPRGFSAQDPTVHHRRHDYHG